MKQLEFVSFVLFPQRYNKKGGNFSGYLVREMRQVTELSFALIFLATSIQSRPLDERKSNGQPTDPGCPPPRCLHESKCYADGEEISRRSHGSGGCHGLLCSNDQIVAWDDFNCGQATTVPAPTSTTRAPSTTPAPSATPSGCINEGVWYPKGSEISRGSDNQGWCYGEICGDDGQVQSWDNFNCDETTPTPTKTICFPFSTTPTRPGCYYDGAWYPPGSYISNGSNGQGWCYGVYCDKDGGIMEYDDFNCEPSTTHVPTTIPLGCLQNGIWYPPGSEISRGSDGNGWCYGENCDQNGQIVAWDDWNCGPMTVTETPSPSSTPSPTPTPTPSTIPTPLGCLQNGIWYPPGSDISRGSDGEGWCYGEYCTHDGQLQLWDDFNCKTSSPTTLPTTLPQGCYYEGKWHPPGIFEGTNVRGCRYGAQCGLNGKVTRWEEFDCRL